MTGDFSVNDASAYLLEAERVATQPPAHLQGLAQPVHVVAVIGAGTMGTGIAIATLDAGFHVTLLEQDAAALERGAARIADYYEQRAKAGKLAVEDKEARIARLSASLDWNALREADVVIEAVFEDMAVKKTVFQKIDEFARRGALLATNTSYLDIDEIADATICPDDFLGLHFFSPAQVMKLLEIVRGKATSDVAMATAIAFGSRLRKVAVPTGNAFGFIGNRIYNAYRRQCEFMLEDGAWPEEIDAALKAFGFAMGPFAVADLSGLDIAWRMRKAQAANRDPGERYVTILDSLCELGRLGRKAGAGYYNYADGAASTTTESVVRQVIERARVAGQRKPRALSTTEIQRRALSAMVNEAALLVEEGVAHRASDVDVVMVRGYGFPQHQGGPIYWARQQGIEQLKANVRELAAADEVAFKAGNLDALFLPRVTAESGT